MLTMKAHISEINSKMAIIKSERPELEYSKCQIKNESIIMNKNRNKKLKVSHFSSFKDILIKQEEPVDYESHSEEADPLVCQTDPPACQTDLLVCNTETIQSRLSDSSCDLGFIKTEYVPDYEIQKAFESKLGCSFENFAKEDRIEDIPQTSIMNNCHNSFKIKIENKSEDKKEKFNGDNDNFEEKSIFAKSKAIQSLIEQKVFPNVNIVNGQMYFDRDIANVKIKKEPVDKIITDISNDRVKDSKEMNFGNKNISDKKCLQKPSVTEEYKCHICGYKCKYLTIYQNHITSHEVSDSLSLYSCTECDYRCSKKYNLTSHMKSHKKAFTCSECGKSFIYNKVLTKEELLHKINKHMLIHKRKQCSGCQKMFSTNQALNKHIILQSSKNPVPCSECDKKFTLKCTFKIHMKTHIEHPFECTKCKKTFSQKGNLNRHLRKHSGEQLVRSPTEREKLILKNPIYDNLLQLHLEHSTSNPKINYNPIKEQKLFKCIRCDNSFSTKFNLRRHLKLIHKEDKFDDILNENKCQSSNIT